MDIAETLAPKSDQLDAIDLAASGPRTFTITSVEKNASTEQPVNVRLKEFDRVWRPGLTMRRLLNAVWGSSKDGAYEGRKVTLYCDPSITFGKEKPGGTRISHMSHIDRPVTVNLPVSKGKSGTFTVQPLKADTTPATTPPPSPADIAACTDADQLRAWWPTVDADTQALIKARAFELENAEPVRGEAW